MVAEWDGAFAETGVVALVVERVHIAVFVAVGVDRDESGDPVSDEYRAVAVGAGPDDDDDGAEGLNYSTKRQWQPRSSCAGTTRTKTIETQLAPRWEGEDDGARDDFGDASRMTTQEHGDAEGESY